MTPNRFTGSRFTGPAALDPCRAGAAAILALAVLPRPALAQGVASEADHSLYAGQAAVAATMRDVGQRRDDVVPGLLRGGPGEGVAGVILDLAFDEPALSPDAATPQRCSTGLN